MNRRDSVFASVAMAVPETAPEYRAIDAQVHVWINDPHYPWTPGTRIPHSDLPSSRGPMFISDVIGPTVNGSALFRPYSIFHAALVSSARETQTTSTLKEIVK